MQTNSNNANADHRAVATALTGMIVRGERNRLADSAAPGLAGARAALETFYHAFNTRSVDLAQRIWADDPLVQLISPVGGLVRGTAGIAALKQQSGGDILRNAYNESKTGNHQDVSNRSHGSYLSAHKRIRKKHMSQLPPNLALQWLDVLLGEWEMESPQFPGGRGRTVFEWLDGRAYVVQRSSVPEPAPTSTWIIGSDEAAESYTALYYDSRGVSRVYRMSISEGVWTVWRDAPGFFQRFTGTFGPDKRTITGRWEVSDDGAQWAHDFDLIYTKDR